jgi:hypothetical protein
MNKSSYYYGISIMFDADSPDEAAARLREIATEIESGYKSGRSWTMDTMDNTDD